MKLLKFVLPLLILILSGCKDEPENQTPNENPNVFDETPFDKVPDTEDIVMYEVNFLAFSSAGNIQGVIARLDSLQHLGVNVIWLMPVYPIGTINSVNSPYSVQNYTKVNPSLGTLEDLRTLVRKAHDRDMALILDWVANHTAWDNPWISNTDWYTQDSEGNIVIPAGTNWQDVADLNYSNSAMRLEMIRSMKYWINQANIDGFRCDAADFVPYGFWEQAIDSLNNMPDRKLILLAEGSRRDHFTAGFQMIYGWDFNSRLHDVFAADPASTLFTTDENEYAGVPAGKQRLRYITNHDISAWDGSLMDFYETPEGTVAAWVITSFLHGVPLLYTAQEIAYRYTISFFDLNPVNWGINPDIYTEYLKIMNVRRNIDAVKTGTIESYPDDDIAAFKRITDSEEVLVLVNVRNNITDFTVPPELAGTWLNLRDSLEIAVGENLSFEPYEYFILKQP